MLVIVSLDSSNSFSNFIFSFLSSPRHFLQDLTSALCSLRIAAFSLPAFASVSLSYLFKLLDTSILILIELCRSLIVSSCSTNFSFKVLFSNVSLAMSSSFFFNSFVLEVLKELYSNMSCCTFFNSNCVLVTHGK